MPENQKYTSLSTLSDLSLLFVDDDDDLRDLISEALEAAGARVLQASSGNEAVRKLSSLSAKELVHCVLTDVRMPDGDGLVVVRYLNSLAHNKPAVIVHSGFNDFTPESAKSLGISALLTKPVKLSILIECIAEHTRKLANAKEAS